MLFDALCKTVMDAIEGCKILLHIFFRQPVYVGDGCVKYMCMELKRDDDVGKIFFIFLEFSSKSPIELNVTFGQSLDEILVLLRKSRKPRSIDHIIALMHDKSM